MEGAAKVLEVDYKCRCYFSLRGVVMSQYKYKSFR